MTTGTNRRRIELPAEDGKLDTVDIGSITLESGDILPDVTVALQRWGALSPTRDNVVLVEHALTGDSHITGPAGPDHPSPGWWSGMVGPGAPIDTDRWCVVATNVLGGCQGTTGPGSTAPDGKPWGSRFPRITIRDQITAEAALLDVLGIETLAAVTGGSMGGMRSLEWVVTHPSRVRAALVLAVGARATADQIGVQSTQIAAIMADPDWQGGDYYETGRRPETGLGVARRMAHLSYRSEEELDSRFANLPQDDEDPWRDGRYAVQSYLDHQATKLVKRFDPGTYVVLSDAMNRHDVGRGRGGVEAALASTHVPTIVAGVDSDRLYPIRLQQEIADGLPHCAGLRVLESRDGHDGFLTEADAVAKLLVELMELASA
ncbi:homoserine O-acetyltransferase [Rhodococcus sp. HNM0563]|uniref:homoserine O-acetyltransferase MetX n=1 Tax=unclassified Rhodococcus (in: high G+C Gram-positive bacteria) TaxID=192944 RepID=UPI00146CF5DD|nr:MULTISPECIES: homoserine O-acetyltransferase [unclassified Rhodococcus (in: high G+C Gram-positive bacteria)]MCK0093346.1 homoserine O-acetyltransferase [Rhodococcus sp. F64268]NLU60748.1 homoserine O-acetyltransferase [Rhodococcus sp. HNM0563]